MKKFMIDREESMLLIIDIQEKLHAAMDSEIQRLVEKNTDILIKTAAAFNMPVVVSEQYRKGLGQTIPCLHEQLNEADNIEKFHFNCMKEDALNEAVNSKNRNTVIIAGMEAHICVMQTALSLLGRGFNVIIASDAVASRRKHDWKMSLSVMEKAGVIIYPTESVSFMIIEKAGTPEFKKIAPLFK